MTQKHIDISQLAKKTGLPASTLRYYEQLGLIQAIGRQGIKRVFNISVLQQLSLISLGRAADFSLKEIGEMLSEKGVHIDRQRLQHKSQQIDSKIKQLVKLRDGLMHAANCRAPSHLECPTFQRLLNLTQKEQVRKAKAHPNGHSAGKANVC